MNSSYIACLKSLRSRNIPYTISKQQSNGLKDFKANREVLLTTKSGKTLKLIFETKSMFKSLISSTIEDNVSGQKIRKFYANNTEGYLPNSITVSKIVENKAGDVLVKNGVEIAHRRNAEGKFLPYIKVFQDYLGSLNERGFKILPPPKTIHL